MLKITGIIILTAIAFVLLKKDHATFAFVLEICVTAGVLILLFPYVEALINDFNDMMDLAGMDAEYVKIIIKCSGIAILSRLAVELCRDAGQNALSAKVEFAAKVLIMMQAMPVYKGMLDLIKGMLERLL